MKSKIIKYLVMGILIIFSGVIGYYIGYPQNIWAHELARNPDIWEILAASSGPVALVVAFLLINAQKNQIKAKENKAQKNTCNIMISKIRALIIEVHSERKNLRENPSHYGTWYKKGILPYVHPLDSVVDIAVVNFQSDLIEAIGQHEIETFKAYQWYENALSRPDPTIDRYMVMSKFLIYNCLMYMSTLAGSEWTSEMRKNILNIIEIDNIEDYDISVSEMTEEVLASRLVI